MPRRKTWTMTRRKTMTDIQSYSGLNPANLDRSDYMNTLAAEALRAGLINESDIDRIRSDLMTALAEVIGYYTKNESSSVMADTANELSESMVYNIDTYLLSLKDDKRALDTLLDRRMSELYGKGYAINSEYSSAERDFHASKTEARSTTRRSTSISGTTL